MGRSVTHATFTITRKLSASPARVFQAFADETARATWFRGPTDQAPNAHTMDFRIGGHESNSGTFHDGITHRFEATYCDIVPNERIVYTYEMYLDDQRISVSVATIELRPAGAQTELTLTESGAFLDGLDRPAQRERGTHDLIEALATSLL